MDGPTITNASFNITPFMLRDLVWKIVRHVNDSFYTPTILHKYLVFSVPNGQIRSWRAGSFDVP